MQLLAAHERLIGASSSLAAPPRARVQAVAHAAVLEVASLLGGRSPVAEAEEGYVAARTHALADLASTVADPRVGDGERDRRRALVEARHEVEQLAGSSSLTEASDLSRQLLAPDEP